jgi:3-oxoadipate enol-lactonase
VVLSHALGGDCSMWDRQLSIVAASYRVLRYDLRGHGRSPGHAGPLSLADLARDPLTLLGRHGIDPVHFCGLSLGGLIGQWLGRYAQHRLRTLILIDSAPRMGSVETWNERIQQIERDGMSSISATTMSRWFTESFRRQQPEVVAHFKNVLEHTSPTDYIACAKVVRDASEQGNNLQRFSTVQVPSLVVTRQPVSGIKRRSHSPVEAGDAFTAALITFLDTQSR